jgi:hypothetical protein
MNAPLPIRLLIAVLTLAFVGLPAQSVAASQSVDWTETINREDVLVQDCRAAAVVSGFSPTLAFGFDFEIMSSYTSDHTFHYYNGDQGIEHSAMEQRNVSFVGTAVNSNTGLSLAYGGHFTRIANEDQSEVTISDLVLHLVPINESAVTIRIERDLSGIIDSPEAMLLAFGPRGLHSSLCGYFAALTAAG